MNASSKRRAAVAWRHARPRSRRRRRPVGYRVYPPTFLRPSAKPHLDSKKMIVATMASVITSVTAFVSTISTASVSRPRPLAATNRESFNLLTATTRLTRSSLQSVRNQVGRSSVRTWSSPARTGLGLATPSGDFCSVRLRGRPSAGLRSCACAGEGQETALRRHHPSVSQLPRPN